MKDFVKFTLLEQSESTTSTGTIMKPKLKHYKFINNPQEGKENPLLIRWFFGVIFGAVALYLVLIVIIVNYSSFFDSPVFGYILTVLVGVPVVWLSLVRIYNQFIR